MNHSQMAQCMFAVPATHTSIWFANHSRSIWFASVYQALSTHGRLQCLWWTKAVGWIFSRLSHSMFVAGIGVSFWWVQCNDGIRRFVRLLSAWCSLIVLLSFMRNGSIFMQGTPNFDTPGAPSVLKLGILCTSTIFFAIKLYKKSSTSISLNWKIVSHGIENICYTYVTCFTEYSTFSVEIKQILYVTDFVGIEEYNKKYCTHNSYKLENKGAPRH